MKKIILGLLVSTFITGIILSNVVNGATENNSIITISEAKAKNLDDSYILASVLPTDIKNTTDIKPEKVHERAKIKRPQVTARDSELRCMARAMYQEANGEGDIGLIAVGHVIMNRLHNPKYPKTVCGVVYEKTRGVCQFAFVCTGGRSMPEDRIKELETVAARVINGETVDPTGGALYFNNTPFHNKYMAYIKKIGGHWFYKNKREA